MCLIILLLSDELTMVISPVFAKMASVFKSASRFWLILRSLSDSSEYLLPLFFTTDSKYAIMSVFASLSLSVLRALRTLRTLRTKRYGN